MTQLRCRGPGNGGRPANHGADLDLLIDAVTEYAIYMIDPEGRIVTWNRGAERSKGYSAGEIIGSHFSRFFTEEDRAAGRPEKLLDLARQTGRAESQGWRVRKDGTRLWVVATLHAIRDASGTLVGFAKITRDETDRRRTEQESLETERRFRMLVEGVTDYAIFMLDPSGIVVNWNSGAERIKGYKASEIVGQHFSRFYTEADRQRGEPERALLTAAKEGTYEREGWRLRKDGTRFWSNVVIDPIYDAAKTLVGFAKITRDITERRRAQDQLIQSERQFRLLIAGVIDYAIFMLDPNGIVSTWNAGAQRIKQYTSAEIVGRHFSAFYTDEDRQAGRPAEALEAARRHGRYESEGWRVRKDGTRFVASVVIDGIHDDDGRLIGFAKVTRDITEKRHAETALQTAREQLAQAQKMEAVGQLTGGIAHDFNNLLMVIGGRIQLMRTRPGASAVINDMEAIERALHRAEALTRQLLAFSRRQALHPTRVDLREWMPRVAEMLKTSLRADINITVRVANDAWPIKVDANELELALINLAVNARDAMATAAGGTLTVTCTNEVLAGSEPGDLAGEFVRIAVIDNGCGIPPELVTRVFEPFFTTKEVGKGTGLGLSQVYGFAQQSGGMATVNSTVGTGTTVVVLLPRSLEAAAPSSSTATDGAEPASETAASILLVEDNDDVAEVTRMMLDELGHRVVHAANAQSALDLLASESIDALVSDIVMPGKMNGLDLARRVREEWPTLPILLISGYSTAGRQAREEGFALLSKPYQTSALDQALRDILRRRPKLRVVRPR